MRMELREKTKTEKEKRREKQDVGRSKVLVQSSPKPDTQTSSVLTGLLGDFVGMALVTATYSRFLGE